MNYFILLTKHVFFFADFVRDEALVGADPELSEGLQRPRAVRPRAVSVRARLRRRRLWTK